MEYNYSKAYKELIEILKYVPKESVNKIPKEMIEMFETKKDKDYNFQINLNKPFEEQELLEETKAILANIFRDYWATPYQKERIEAKEKYDRQKLEQEKRNKYNPNDIFNTKTNLKEELKTTSGNNNNNNNNLPVEAKKQKFYQRLIRFIKKWFLINKR